MPFLRAAIRSIPLARLVLVLVPLVSLAPSPARAAWPHDPWVNVQVAPSSADQKTHQVIPDGQGGVIVAWVEARTFLDMVFVQRIGANGQIAPGWPATGRAVVSVVPAGALTAPALVSDGLGGAFIAWQDDRNFGSTQSDIYMQHIAPTGVIAPSWPAEGVRLTSDSHDENKPSITSDGTGGVFVVWETVWAAGSPGDIDLYGARVLGNGSIVWSLALYNPIDEQKSPRVVSDGANGFVVCFLDNFDGAPGGSALFAVRAIRWNATPAVQWIADASNGPFDHKENKIMADGAGGYLFSWVDYRYGNPDVFANRLTSGGVAAPGWDAAGNAVCVDPAIQDNVDLAADGSQGVFVVWDDRRTDVDVYGNHLTGSGQIVSGWDPGDGNPISSGLGGQSAPSVVSDGAGGAYVAWNDSRDPIVEVRMTHCGPTPALAPGWGVAGNIVSATGNLGTKAPKLVWDGGSGCIATFLDERGPTTLLYAQRMDRFGVLGNPEPAITAIRDVVADQGGRVRIAWNASWVDSDPTYGVWAYWVWRQVPAATAQAAVARGAVWVDDRDGGAESRPQAIAIAAGSAPRLFMRASETFTSAAYAWEFVASQATSGFPTYSYTASTTTDSMPGSNPLTVFMVQARGIALNTYWSSAPDSGYSVDNLAPGSPSPFTGSYASGVTHLHWGRNLEPDLLEYRVYRGASAGFVPGPGNLIASQPDTGYASSGPAGSYYKLSALDVHGNESPFASLSPSSIVGVPEGGPAASLWLAPPTPNPARGAVTLRFALPIEAETRLAIYDLGGRAVRELVSGRVPAGEQTIQWDGRDAHGRPHPSGLYWVRLETSGRWLTRRLIWME